MTNKNELTVGQILECKWGYDQTNVDFYQVVKTTARQVVVNKINSIRIECHQTMSGRTTPVPNSFTNDIPLRRKVSKGWNGENWNEIKIESYSTARPWNGVAKTFTSYA